MGTDVGARPGLRMFVIYDHPLDHPTKFVVREWMVGIKATPNGEANLADTLEEARAFVPPGLVNIGRNPSDEPQIAEVWV